MFNIFNGLSLLSCQTKEVVSNYLREDSPTGIPNLTCCFRTIYYKVKIVSEILIYLMFSVNTHIVCTCYNAITIIWVFNLDFNDISVILLRHVALEQETRLPAINHRTDAMHCKTRYHIKLSKDKFTQTDMEHSISAR